MNRDEKNEQTRNKIIDSALVEFGEKPYAQASLNTVCAAGNISKGIIYHYFKDKDELYLSCVKECFASFSQYLQAADFLADSDVSACLQHYFSVRFAFFEQNPLCFHIFYEARCTPVRHLAKKIAESAAALDHLHLSFFKTLTGVMPASVKMFC